MHVLTSEQQLPGTPEDVFGFFGDALNLEAITPPWLGFRVTTPGPIAMAPGTLMRDTVRYALPLGPIGELAHAAFVRRDLERIFDFRRAEVARCFIK